MLRRVSLLSTALCLMLSGQAVAQSGPSFDCARASGAAESLVCEDEALAALDRRIAARFAEALAAARGIDAGAQEAEAGLRAMQRGWIGGRNECWKSEDLRACVELAYLNREAVLVATWFLEPSTGTTFWTCDNNPANEVVTMGFDTAPPSLRIERGDTVDAAVRVPTASGEKYEGSFGRSIWIKGDAATYREADPDGTEVRCRRAG